MPCKIENSSAEQLDLLFISSMLKFEDAAKEVADEVTRPRPEGEEDVYDIQVMLSSNANPCGLRDLKVWVHLVIFSNLPAPKIQDQAACYLFFSATLTLVETCKTEIWNEISRFFIVNIVFVSFELCHAMILTTRPLCISYC